MAGKVEQQELEAAGHTVSAVRKRREVTAGAQLLSSFHSAWAQGCMPINTTWKLPQRYAQRFVSSIILGSVRFTAEVSVIGSIENVLMER